MKVVFIVLVFGFIVFVLANAARCVIWNEGLRSRWK